MNTGRMAQRVYVYVLAYVLVVVGMASLLGRPVVAWVAWDEVTLDPGASLLVTLLGIALISVLRAPSYVRSGVLSVFAAAAILASLASLASGQNGYALSDRLDETSSLVPLAMLLAAIGIFLSGGGSRAKRLAVGVGILLIALGCIALPAVWVTGADNFRLGTRATPASVLALLIILSGAGMIVLSGGFQGDGHRLHRRTVLVGASAVIVSCLGWMLLSAQAIDDIHQRRDALHAKIAYLTDRNIDASLLLMRRMAERWQALGRLPEIGFRQQEVDSYLRDIPYLSIVSVLDSGNVPLWDASRDVRFREWLSDYTAITGNRDWMMQALADGSPHMSRVARQGATSRKMAMIVVPLRIPDMPSALLVAGIDLEELFEQLDIDLGEFGIEIRSEGETVYQSGIDAATKPMPVGTMDWRSDDRHLWSTTTYVAHHKILLREMALPATAFGLSLALSFFLTLNHALRRQATERAETMSETLAQLEGMRARNRHVMDYSQDMLCFMDEDGRFLHVSRACEEQLGYRPDEIIGHYQSDYLHPEDVVRTHREMKSVMNGRATLSLRNRYRHRDGRTVNLLWSLVWSKTERSYFGAARDITDAVRNEHFMESQSEILSLISRDRLLSDILGKICRMVERQDTSALCSVMLADKDGRVLRLASGASLPVAYRQQLQTIAIGPEAGSCGTSAFLREPVVSADIENDPLWRDYRDAAISNTIRACSSTPIISDRGVLLGTISIYHRLVHDPSDKDLNLLEKSASLAKIAIERNNDRASLADSEQRSRSLFIRNPDPVISLDPAGLIRDANAAAEALIGLPRRDIVGRHLTDIVAEADAALARSQLSAALSGDPRRYEIRFRGTGNALRHLDMTSFPITVSGNISGVFCIAKDITDQKIMTSELEAALARSERRAEQLRGLSETVIATTRMRDYQSILDYLVEQARLLIGAHQSVISFTQSKDWSQALSGVSLSDKYARWRGYSTTPDGCGIYALVCETNQPMMLTQSELEKHPRWHGFGKHAEEHPPMNGWLAVPLVDRDGRNVGVLQLSDKLHGEFDEDDMAIARQFASMTVGALETFRLFDEISGTESRLKSQLEFTTTITDTIGEGLLAVDMDGKIAFLNPAATSMLGAGSAAIEGQSLEEYIPLTPAGWRNSDSDAGVSGEINLLRPRSSILLYAAKPMYSADIQTGWVVILRDVTEERKALQALRVRNQFFDLSLELFFMIGRDGCIVQANPAIENLLEYPPGSLAAIPWREVVGKDDHETVDGLLRSIAAGCVVQDVDVSVVSRRGELRWIRLNAEKCEDEIVYCAARDITERRSSEKQLQILTRALESTYNGVVIVDAVQNDQPVIYVNKAFERITGYSREDVIGRNCRLLQGSERDEARIAEIASAIAEARDAHVVLRNYRKDGTPFWNALFISPVFGESGELENYVGVLNDISDQIRYESELSHSATHDLLTGLPNRSLLEDRLRQACSIASRYKRHVAVMFVDLDRFKPINDSFGHEYGDKILIEVANRMQQQVRPGDTVGRMAGDEFIVILPDLANPDDVAIIAENMIEVIGRPYEIDDIVLHVTSSIGVAVSDGQIEQPTTLIQHADMAMYKAKEDGRNNYHWYTNDLDLSVSDRLLLRADLQKAMDDGDFELHYQTQVDTRSGRVVGIEALLRWKHPERGYIPPDEFIPIAEDSGQIVPIGYWVLDTACSHLKQLVDSGMRGPSMAVNISSIQFQRRNFVDIVKTTLEKYSLDPRKLELELTESVLLDNVESAISTLCELKKLGVKIAIDDFGTGFSSLSYLKQLPIDKVKIDRSFVREIISNENDAAIAQGIISMAHHLKLKVIAEGVETEAQLAFLKRNHCDECQGFYFSKPIPFEALSARLRESMLTIAPTAGDKAVNEETQTLLLLDDEENVLRALARVLRRDAYRILMATRAQDAFELLAQNDVQVIISDQRMPEMNGTEFLSRVKKIYPNTIRIVLSGYTDLKSVTEAINEGAIYRFLTKPWDDDQLRQIVAQAFRDQTSLPGNRK